MATGSLDRVNSSWDVPDIRLYSLVHDGCGACPVHEAQPDLAQYLSQGSFAAGAGGILVILLGLEKTESKDADIDYRRLHEYKLGQAVMLLALMVAYALRPAPAGFPVFHSRFPDFRVLFSGRKKMACDGASLFDRYPYRLVSRASRFSASICAHYRALSEVDDMLEGLLIGLQTALSFQNILMVIGGCLIGTFIGMLPGLGPMSIIAIMIPVAISMGDPSAALILLAGVYYGAIFGGSTSSILLNAPGVAGTVASSFDGYPMAKQGKAGKALTIAAIASFAGGSIGAILLMIFAPALSSVALLFHSAEYFALMVVGLSAIAAFAGTGQVAKALMMTILWPHHGHCGRRRVVQSAALYHGDYGPSVGFWLHYAGHGDVCPARGAVPGS